MADDGRHRVVVTMVSYSQENNARNVRTEHEEDNMQLADVKALQKSLGEMLVARASE